MASVPFNNLITFSRGSNATVTGSNGLIQWAPNNLLSASEQFDNAAWTLNAATVGANTIAAPNSTTTADTLTATAGTGVIPRVGNLSIVTVDSSSYTASLYIKAGTYTFAQIYINNQGTEWANFTLTGAGTATANGASTAAIEALANGWYRVSMTYTAGGADRRPFFMLAASASATRAQTWNPVGTETIIIWGAQLELGSTATTYNPTTVKNLLGYSEAFDNAAWNKANASIVTGAQANPINGAFNAQKLMENTANAQHRVTQSVTLAAAPHTLSAYLKAGERTWALMLNGTVANGFTYFDLSAGVVGSIGAGVSSASITAVGNGWYRCAIIFTAPAGGNVLEFRTASANGSGSYTGDGNSGVYIYGAQLSDSASLDPYVPTPGAAPSSTAYYGPRFDYDPVTLAPNGILVEEARTNGNLYSEDLSNAYWTVSGASLSGGNTAPSGSPVAYKLVENTANSTHQIGRATLVSATNATAYTMSFYVKAAGRSRLRLYIYGFNNYTPIIDLTSRTVVSATGGTAPVVTFTNVADGYIRVAITDTTTFSELQFDGIFLVSTGTTFSYLGDGVSGVILWGFQREQGAFATSYIPTIASTVTRSADVATITGSLFGQWYRQSEGTFILEMSQVALGEFSRFFEAADATFNTRKPLLLMNSSNQYVMQFRDNGVDQASPVVGVMAANMVMRLSAAYKTNDFAGTLNGGTPATDTSGVVTTAVDRLFIGSGGSAPSDQISCHIRYAAYYPVRLADFQLQALTELPLVSTLDLDFLNNLYEA